MVSLEQVKLLDSKVYRLIDYVNKANEENKQLKERLNTNQKRIDELEILVKQFKQEQSRIEEGILSALDRLNQFEDALESKLSTESALSTESKLSTEGKPVAERKVSEAIPETAAKALAAAEPDRSGVVLGSPPVEPKADSKAVSKEEESAPGQDIDPLEEEDFDSGELDIF